MFKCLQGVKWMSESLVITSLWKINEECFHLGLYVSSTFNDDLKSQLTFKAGLNNLGLWLEGAKFGLFRRQIEGKDFSELYRILKNVSNINKEIYRINPVSQWPTLHLQASYMQWSGAGGANFRGGCGVQRQSLSRNQQMFEQPSCPRAF